MGSSLPANTTLNIGWLFFRLHIGLSIAIHAGWPKMSSLAAPGWFNDQVSGLGFTFPSPAFWATLASWGEFVGGIGIALGFLTRFNALQLAFQFFVISFLWYDKPEPLTGMYFQQTLFWGYVITVFAGSGRFSIDHLLLHRKKSVQSVAGKLAITCLLVFITLSAPAQSKALSGSGKVITKTFNYNGFDKIDLRNLDGLATIEIGKSFGVEVVIDDNLEYLLEAAVVDGMLRVELKGNSNNRLYIENTNIRVNITMPEISVLRQNGNNDLRVNGIVGRYFRIEHSGNGNAIINGSIDELDVRKDGNGNLDAAGLVAGKANLKKQGNGDLLFNTAAPFTIEGSGNGDMINKGAGRAIQEKLSGNGRLLYPSAAVAPITQDQSKLFKVRISNETDKRVELYVVYPVNGRFGIDIQSGRTSARKFPAGTRLYLSRPQLPDEPAFYTVTELSGQKCIISQQ